MIFVTTGQRIAVENFSKGVIYKVTFTDESISYMMCVGIGKDFVMLQSTDPLLFSLTMQSASRVSTIDVHDPTPPEPPTPIENALQYQTGEPPFTFTTTENSLFSWYIEGEAGVKTANLFNIADLDAKDHAAINDSGVEISSDFTGYTLNYIDCKPDTDYTIYNTEIARNGGYYRLYFYDISKNFISRSASYVFLSKPLLWQLRSPANAYYFQIQYGYTSAVQSWEYLMILEGLTVPDHYIPYGKYEISILTNEHSTTIYLDEPIAEGEKLYSVNVDAQIVTDIGENTLSVSDPQPPEMQIVYGIYAEA